MATPSSDILIGYTGTVSFGHSAFFGLGMYGAAALLTVRPPRLRLAGVVSARFTPVTLHWFSLAVVTGSYWSSGASRARRSATCARPSATPRRAPAPSATTWSATDDGRDALGSARGRGRRALRGPEQVRGARFRFFLISGETVIFNAMGGVGTLVGLLAGTDS